MALRRINLKKNVIKVEIRIEWSGLSFGNVSHNLEFK